MLINSFEHCSLQEIPTLAEDLSETETAVEDFKQSYTKKLLRPNVINPRGLRDLRGG